MSGVTFQALAGMQGATWQTTFSTSLSVQTTQSFQTETTRLLIPQASLTVTGGNMVRFTMVPHNTIGNDFVIDAMYVQQASSGYSATGPAFNSTPVQVLVGGSGTFTLTSGGSNVVSDPVSLTIPSSNGLAIAIHFNNAANRNLTGNSSGFTIGASYKAGNDASTVAASGYTQTTGPKYQFIVSTVEVYK